MSLSFRLAAAALGLVAPSIASAAWHKASSKHFVIYADENPKRLQEYAAGLERFDQAARVLMQMDDHPVGDGNRLTVFVLPSDVEVRKLIGDKTGFISGFYSGRARGSLAYVPKRSGYGGDGGLGEASVFYHEYAHHLMMQQLDQPYPEWYVEGFAEFLSVPRFEKDGKVGLGAPPQHRSWGLHNDKPLPLETMLGGTFSISKLAKQERESIYGRGWLLVHYLIMEPKRRDQLSRYILAISQGVPAEESARTAFGDLAQLDKELKAYLSRNKFAYFQVAPAKQAPPIEVTPLTEGAAQIILLRSRVKYEAEGAATGLLLAEARQIQARFPSDPLVEATLAEAELNAEQFEAAEAAADRALKANPQNPEAIILKGRAIVGRAEKDGGDSRGLFKRARNLFIGANKIDPEDPEPLMEFHHAFIREGERPTANAIEALHYASNLAPQDLGLRMNSATQHLMDNKLKDARAILAPVAYSPHGGPISEAARRMIAKIDAGDGRAALRAASRSADEGGLAP